MYHDISAINHSVFKVPDATVDSFFFNRPVYFFLICSSFIKRSMKLISLIGPVVGYKVGEMF